MVEVMGFIVSILLGALIGLQREQEQQETKVIRFAGIRTFILISFLGAILGHLSDKILGSYVLVFIGFIGVILFAIASYVVTYFKYKDNTATTEIASIITFIIGVMATTQDIAMAVILGIVVAGFLTFKQKLHGIAKKINKQEVLAIVEFALLALVVLPLLPNKSYSPLDVPILKDVLLSLGISFETLSQLAVFNLYHIWLMVIFIAGISFLGYILVKFLGTNKGYGLTGFVGGLVSSTAVTLSMSGESKSHPGISRPFVVAVVIASSTTFIRMIVEVIVVNNNLLSSVLIPMGLMGVVGYLSAGLLYFKKTKKKTVDKKIEYTQPFAIGPALKFGLFFAFIIFISKLAQIIAGANGIYFASILSGLADVDAITLTMSSLSRTGEISNMVATTAIILAAASNTCVKAGIAWFLGEKTFARYILVIFGLVLLVGLGSLLLI